METLIVLLRGKDTFLRSKCFARLVKFIFSIIKFDK